jgi:hypothetical protein
MRFVSRIVATALIFVFSLTCGKDSKPATRPEDQGQAVTLQYQNYYYHMGSYWNCIRLTLDDNPVERCGLGTQAMSIWVRSYQWRLYIIDMRQVPETYIPVASGTVQIDRNITCIVNGNTITWE